MRFFINGTEYEPANRNQFEVSFANSEITDGREGQLTNDVLQFFAPSDGFSLLQTLFQTNSTEAVDIRVEDIGITLFDGYGSFLHPDTLISPDEIQIKMLDQYQSIKERIDVLTFDLLHEKGFITQQDYTPILCVLDLEDSTEDAIARVLAGFALYTIIKETIFTIKVASDALSAVAGGLTGAIEAIGIILALLVYLIATFTAIKELLKTITENLFPIPRFWNGMKEKTQFENIARYFGLEFQSTTIYDGKYANATTLPQKEIRGSLSFDPTDRGYDSITCGDFIQRMEQKYSTILKIRDGKLIFESEDYYRKKASSYQIPSLSAEQNVFSTNADELAHTILVQFQRDELDKHTYNNKGGYLTQSYSEVNGILPRQSMLSISNKVLINETRGHRKDNLTGLEKVLEGVLKEVSKVTDAVISVAEDVLSFLGMDSAIPYLDFLKFDFNTRLGALKISDFRTSVPKFLIVDNDGRLNVNNDQLTSSEELYNTYHYLRNIQNNQWQIHNTQQIPLSFKELTKVEEEALILEIVNSNYILSSDGYLCLILDHQRDADGLHHITYRMKKEYINKPITETITVLK